MEDKLVIISKMSKAFPTGEGDFLALRNIDLSFMKGEFSGIVGPSAAAKPLCSISSVRLILRQMEMSR